MLDAVWLVDAASAAHRRGQPRRRRAARRRRARRCAGAPCDALSRRRRTWRSGATRPPAAATRSNRDTWLRRADGTLRAGDAPRQPARAGRRRQRCTWSRCTTAASSARRATSASAGRRAAATLESTADGILVTDLAGRIRGFNRRFAALWDAARRAARPARRRRGAATGCARSVVDPARLQAPAGRASRTSTLLQRERHAHAALGPGAASA